MVLSFLPIYGNQTKGIFSFMGWSFQIIGHTEAPSFIIMISMETNHQQFLLLIQNLLIILQ